MKDKDDNEVLSEEEVDALLSQFNSFETPEKKREDWQRWGSGYLYEGEGKEKVVTVPSKYRCTRQRAFYENEEIEEVIIEEGVTEIAPESFYSCVNLKKVTLPSTLTFIGREAFKNCSSLTEIKLGNHITEIEQGAFYDTGLKEIVLPKNMQVIRDGCFNGCTSLTSVTFPPSLVEIEDGAFSCCHNLKEVNFPPSLEIIGTLSFSDCTSLTELTLPSSIRSLGLMCFVGCSSIQSLKINCNMYYIHTATVFDGCENVKNIEINGNLNEIDHFDVFKSLETVILNKSIIRVGNGCFNNLNKLSMVVFNPILLKEENQYTLKRDIYDTMPLIGDGIFSGCSSLRMINQNIITSPFFTFGSYLNSYLGDEEDVVIPEGIKVIKQMAFYKNENIKTVTIPDSVEEIGEKAFYGCTKLEKVIGGVNLKKVGKDIFYDCPHVSGEVIQKDENFLAVNNVATSVFEENLDVFPELKNKTIITPSFVHSFVPYLFNISDLQSIVISEGVEELCEELFTNCRDLESVILPKSLKLINKNVFLGCDNLKEIRVPKDCEIIDKTVYDINIIRE